MEIIAVDDGSTDNSGDLVQSFAERDHRIKFIRQANGGLSAARNTGLTAARGEFLAFLDSDDIVEPGALQAMVEGLKASKSDFAVASYRHLRSDGITPPGTWIAQAHQRDRIGTRLEDFPDILVNAVIWSKVFRRAFWDRNGLTFREGVLYEDQELSTAAFCLANSFDILSRPVIQWRIRETGDSITQNANDPENLASRFDSSRRSLEVLKRYGHQPEMRTRALQYLANNTFTLQHIRFGDQDYLDVLEQRLPELTSLVSTNEFRNEVPVYDKVLYYLILEGRSDEAAAAVLREIRNIQTWDTHIVDGLPHGKWAVDPALTDSLPGWVTELTERSTSLQSIVTQAFFDRDRFVIKGNAYIANLPIDDTYELEINAIESTTGCMVTLDTIRFNDSEAVTRSGQRYIDYSASGFEASTNVNDLFKKAEELTAWPSFKFLVSVSTSGVRRDGYLLKRTVGGSLRTPESIDLSAKVRASLTWSNDEGLALSFEQRRFYATDIVASERLTSIHIKDFAEKPSVLESAYLHFAEDEFGPKNRYQLGLKTTSSPNEYILTFDDNAIYDRLSAGSFARFLLRGSDGRFPLHLELGHVLTNPGEITLRRAHSGRALLQSKAPSAFVTAVKPDEETVTVVLKASAEQQLSGRLLLAGIRETYEADLVQDEPGHYHATFHLMRAVDPEWKALAPASGQYTLLAESTNPVDVEAGRSHFPLQIPLELARTLPILLDSPSWQIKVSNGKNFKLAFQIAPPTFWSELSGGLRRQSLHDAYAQSTQPLVSNRIYLQCLRGDQVADSQLALSREIRRRSLDVDIVWGVIDHSIRVPASDRSVVIDSAEYYEALSTSKVICVNHELRNNFVKRPGQVVVQTYHGHPFKSMGMSRWDAFGYRPGQIAQSLKNRESWDLLLSPSELATQLYRENYPVGAEIVEIGHPRNDRLVNTDQVERTEIRSNLGIKPDLRAVLYAPTWRDLATHNPWAAPLVNFVSAEDLAEALGPGYVVLLRGHPANGRFDATDRSAGSVVDVTFHPDINDLIIASDIGVFDYSSIRFDYSVTRKPMVYLVPDKDQYFEFTPALIDYDETVAGPQVGTLDELVDAVKDQFADPQRWKSDYSRLIEKFNHLDDGKASERFLNSIARKAGW